MHACDPTRLHPAIACASRRPQAERAPHVVAYCHPPLTLVPKLKPVLQRELHDLAGGHGPEFDLQEHLPQLAGASQAATTPPQQQQEQQQGDAGGQAQQSQQPGGLEPMATE